MAAGKENGAARRSNSLVWKLVFIQIRRLLSIFSMLNLIVVIVCAAALMWWLEWQAGSISRSIQAGAAAPRAYATIRSAISGVGDAVRNAADVAGGHAGAVVRDIVEGTIRGVIGGTGNALGIDVDSLIEQSLEGVDELSADIDADALVRQSLEALDEQAGSPPDDSSGQAVYLPLPSVVVTIAEYPFGVRLDSKLEESLGLPQGSWRGFQLSTEAPRHITWPYWRWGDSNLHYVASVPAPDSMYYQIRLDMGTPVRLFLLIGLILFVCEIWYTLWTILSAKRAVRRALRPLYELTMTAQNITVEQEQPIPLGGAIDTLNAITEEHLDRRISIEDERDELQGLASAINNMLDRLDAAYKSQLRFVSDASHELRTPIAIIQGYANLLSRWGKDDPTTLQESVDAIKSEAVGMQSLIEQLLFLARSDNRSIPIHLKRVNLSALATEVAKETRMIVSIHQIEERIESDLHVMGDIQLLKQAMRIFIDNAIKYSPDGGMIIIGVKNVDNMVQVRITDHGTGIPEQDLPNLFERFWRADESRARKTGGTGLGLSIAKWIVDSHHGQIEVLSRKEMGTRMSILMPMAVVLASQLPESGDVENVS